MTEEGSTEAARIAETAGYDERISELESLDAEMIRSKRKALEFSHV